MPTCEPWPRITILTFVGNCLDSTNFLALMPSGALTQETPVVSVNVHAALTTVCHSMLYSFPNFAHSSVL